MTENTDLIALRNEGDNAFENVKMPTTIFIGKKSAKNQWNFDRFNLDITILQNIETNTVKLSEISKMIRGMEFGRDKISENGQIPLITGSNICKYGITKLSFIKESIFNEFSKEKYYFTGERILLRETGSQLMTLYLDNELYSNRNLFNIKIINERFSPKFVLACLNSKLLQFYYQTRFKADSELFPKIRIVQAKELPIPDISLEDQQAIISLVEQILAAKKENPVSDTSILEKEIDRLIYELYELTKDEIAIIEQN